LTLLCSTSHFWTFVDPNSLIFSQNFFEKSSNGKSWVKAEYNGIPVQLFIIRYGRSSKYEVMVTTDMKLSFKDVFERYQIRWNIEVLFYEKHIVMRSELSCQ